MIHVEGLWKHYDGRPALKGVDLHVGHGERVALVGPNGSGKTTLIRALLGVIECRGQLRVGGHDPLRDHAAALAHVAYVPQRSPALPVPVKDVVAFWSKERRLPADRVTEITRAFGMDLEACWNQRFSALSGGTQQKLLAAMALATDCQLLLLDEPTANLDPHSRAEFFERLTERSPAPTLLLSSHRVDEIRPLVDRVVVLADGVVTFDGPADRFLADTTLAESAGVLTFPRPA